MPREVPQPLAQQLPTLYQSTYATAQYASLFYADATLGVCVLEEPPTIVLLADRGRTVEVVNRLCGVSPATLERGARALYRAYPRAHLIRAEVPFSADKLQTPARILVEQEDVVVHLPPAYDQFVATLSRATRKHTRNYRNRLQRDYPDHRLCVYEAADIPPDLLHHAIRLSRDRLRQHGRTSGIDATYEARLVELCHAFGFLVAVMIGDRVVAADLATRIGTHVYVHTGSFDPAFSRYELGWLTALGGIQEAVARGVRFYHLLWGRHEYKLRLGGVPQPLHIISIYRSSAAASLHVDTRAHALCRSVGRAIAAAHWHAHRHLDAQGLSAVRRARRTAVSGTPRPEAP